MNELEPMLHLTPEEECNLKQILSLSQRRQIIERINRFSFYVRELQKEIVLESKKLEASDSYVRAFQK